MAGEKLANLTKATGGKDGVDNKLVTLKCEWKLKVMGCAEASTAK